MREASQDAACLRPGSTQPYERVFSWHAMSARGQLIDDGDDANGEADVVVAVAKAGAGDTGDAGFLEEREGIFALAQLAPVIDGGVVVDVDVFKEMLFRVNALQLCDEARAAQAIETAQLFREPGARAHETDVGHEPQLPFGRHRGHAVGPAGRDGGGQRGVADGDPAKAVARERVRLGETADEDGVAGRAFRG